MGGVIGESNGEEGGMRRRGESLENSKTVFLGKALSGRQRRPEALVPDTQLRE